MERNVNLSLTEVISTAVQIPGVKVNRDAFLCEAFKEADDAQRQILLEKGPIAAGFDREQLKKKAQRLIQERTVMSTGASFMAGIPGGLAMAATIPADMLQYYGVALRMAQELAYLYGEEDIEKGDIQDRDRVINQLIIYCGVMLGATGAAQMVRVMSSALAKQLAKKLPQKALTKTMIYPVVRSICKFFGVQMTKKVFANGIGKIIPVVGGVVAGGLTFATMLPMGQRLADTLDEAHFGYTVEEFEDDWDEIVEIMEADQEESGGEVTDASAEQKRKIAIPNFLAGKKRSADNTASPKSDVALDKIQKAKQMLDEGILTEQEFADIKAKVISEM